MGRMRVGVVGLMVFALSGAAGCAGMKDDDMDTGASAAAEASAGMEMSQADKDMMASCKAMSHAEMTKNERCMQLMRKSNSM